MSLTDQIFEAGVVGCGGAGFPTHVKLRAKADYLIINGVECEPLLSTDRFLMRNKTSEILRAAGAAAKETGAEHCVIAMKRTYQDEIAAVKNTIDQSGAEVEIKLLDSFYPVGDEQAVVYEVTGRTVPPGGIPLDVGAVVSNVGTMFAVSEAMDGRSFTHKYLTVAGEVKRPTIEYVPIGTPVSECIALAGGAQQEQFLLVNGGPMMGRPIRFEDIADEVVTKTTSGILAFKEDSYLARKNGMRMREIQMQAASACTQCSFCTQLCPRFLLGNPLEPHKIMRRFAHSSDIRELLSDPVVRSAALCCECGVCTVFACPMGLQPSAVNSMLRKELRAAGIRTDGMSASGPREEREWRKVPSGRIAVRAGVAEYCSKTLDCLICAESHHVSIPLSQGAGMPAEPIVEVGEWVEAGQRIADCPRERLGSNVHASITGVVLEVGERIVIDGGVEP
ncbi:Electron transport complex subunit RsxC [bioreactor metagenome]|uniref:Electron transport complex subunit RsxC n=1 Tax=bioreactor metagenome TaxID=1076179 RepID=A0A644YSB7_9ZZZZ